MLTPISAFLACSLSLLAPTYAEECHVVAHVSCGEDGCVCSGPEDKYCIRESKIDCVNGQCSNGQCVCNSCWTGVGCDVYKNDAVPTFAAAEQEIEVLAAGEQRVAFAAAADADAVECYRMSGRVHTCQCAEIRYEISEADDEDAVSIPNSAQPLLRFVPGKRSPKAGSKVVIAASNPGSKDAPATLLIQLKVVDKLSNPARSPYEAAAKSDSATDTAKSRRVRREDNNAGQSVDSSISSEQVLSRHKRGALGAGVPDLMTFTLTRTVPSATNTFKIGDLLTYQLSIWMPKIATDCLVEVYSQRAWSTLFAISNLKVASRGSNIAPTASLLSATGMYESAAGDGRYDRGYIDLGTINNTASEVATAANSQILLTFNALALKHPAIVDGSTFTISVGVQYLNQSQVWVAVDTLSAAGITSQLTTSTAYTSTVAPSFSLQGPSVLSVGCSGVWTLRMTIRDLYNYVTITAFALNSSASLVVDRISLENFGAFYSSYGGLDDSSNFTVTSMDSSGTIMGSILDMGHIINSGFNTYAGNAGSGNYTITAQLVARLSDVNMDISTNSTYYLGLSVAISDSLVYSTAAPFTVKATELQNVTLASTFTLSAVTPLVTKGALASFLLNMTLPPATTQDYTVEVAGPFNSTTLMNLTRVRVMSVGYNYPSFSDPVITYSKNDTINNDYAIVDFGLVSNTGQRNGSWANTISVEIVGQLLDTTNVAIGQTITVVVGVRLGSSSFWVGQSSFVVAAAPAALVLAPAFSLTNLMNDAYVYPWSSVAYYLDVYIPPATTVSTLTVNAFSSVSSGLAVTKISKMEVYQVGSGIVFSNGNTLPNAVYYNSTNEYAPDGSPVSTSAQMTFPSTTNVLAQDWPWLALPLSTIRLRIVVQGRSNAQWSGLLLSTNVSVTYSGNRNWLAQDLITYNSTQPQPFANMVAGQPRPFLTIGNRQSNAPLPVLFLGSALAFDFVVSTPFLTVTDLNVTASTGSPSVSICKLYLRKLGKDMGPPMEAYNATYTRSNNQTSGANLLLRGITNIEPYNAFDADYTTTTVYYNLVVMLRDVPTTTSRNYSYNYGITTSGTLSWNGAVTFEGRASPATTMINPVVFLTKANNLTSITIGGGALYVLYIYVPPGTTARYRLEVYGPWGNDNAGKLGLWDARVMSSGDNVPCVDGAYIGWYNTQYNSTFDPAAQVNDTIVMDLGYLSNVANDSTLAVRDAANLVTVEILAKIPAISSAAVNDTLSLSTALYYNGSNAWAGFLNATVIADAIPSDSSGAPFLVIQPQDANAAQPIGVLKTWNMTIAIPRTMTPLKLDFNMGVANSEALMTIHYIRVLSYGANLVYSTANITYSNNSVPPAQMVGATVDFGNIVNAYTSHRDLYRGPGTSNDDVVTVSFDVMVSDNIANTNGAIQTFGVLASYLTNGVPQSKLYQANITVVSLTNDSPIYDWNAWTDNYTSPVLQNDVISMQLFINLTASSRRVPRNLVAHYRIPYFSQFLNVTNYTGKVPDRVNWSTRGVDIQWNVLYFGEYASLTFAMKLDPNNTLLPGLLTQAVTIPVDLTYNRISKTDITGNAYDYMYTKIIPVQFTAYIPECYTPQGMESKKILDCQITASSNFGTNTATEARLNVGKGWVSAPRGPPFYKSEYVQVDMGVQTKFTAIRVQPQRGFANESIASFYIQYSKLGLRWFDAIDVSGNKRLFQPNFTSSPSENETVLLQFGGQPFVGQFIRIIPQNTTANRYYQRLRFELYGCLATGSVAKNYTCPAAVSQIAIVQRQMLMNPNDGRLFVCMLEAVGGNVVCSYTSDFGTSWFSVDDNVCNINFYSNKTGSLYGVARSQDMYMRSDDLGDTWFAIETSEYTNATSVSSFVTSALTMPFTDWENLTPAALKAKYNFTFGSHVWSVDVNGILYDTTSVAWWGQSVWSP